MSLRTEDDIVTAALELYRRKVMDCFDDAEIEKAEQKLFKSVEELRKFRNEMNRLGIPY
jgi:hypothetical protein